MRNSLIKKLDYKARQWLYKAVFQMILADKNVAKEEVDSLLESLRRVSGKDIKDFSQVTSSPEFLVPLKPLRGISYDHAFIIVAELVRVAAIDSRIALEEAELLKEVLSLLDFDNRAIQKVVKWAKQLATVNAEEHYLKEELLSYYLSS
ncbi:MAG: hypothetical protein MJE63_02250 [Proteobacteria bacterium]|nr:hypothetical protein [Pseudomonadota bacterium]